MRTALLWLALAAALPLAARATPEADAFKGTTAYCYFNAKTLTWRLGNDLVERVIHFDRDTGGLQTLRVQDKRAGRRIAPAPAPEGEFHFAADTQGRRPDPVRLDGDWAFNWQSVARTALGGRRLTIHLHGKGRYRGYEAEAQYDIYPGNRPYLVKSLTLVNRTGEPRTVEEIIGERWILVAQPTKRAAAGASGPEPPSVKFVRLSETGAMLNDATGRTGLVTMLRGAPGEIAYENGVVVARVRPGVEIGGNGGRVSTPEIIVAAYEGAAETGAALYRRYRERERPTAGAYGR